MVKVSSMKRVGLFISTFFIFLALVLFTPSLRQSVFAACSSNGYGSCTGSCAGTCYATGQYSCACRAAPTATKKPTPTTNPCPNACGSGLSCNGSAGNACRQASGSCTRCCPSGQIASGGSCIAPTPTTDPCPYSACGSGLSCNGSAGSWCKQASGSCTKCCPSGQTASGGSCITPATNTPIPKYTCNTTTGNCDPGGSLTLSQCSLNCVKDTPTPTTPPSVTCSGQGSAEVCGAKNCGAGYNCSSYFNWCQCMPGPTATPKACAGSSGDQATCSTRSCGSGNCVSHYVSCYCETPTNTPTNTPVPKYVCNGITGACDLNASGSLTLSQCSLNCVKNTPTPTTTYTCVSKGGTCKTNVCSAYGLCAVSGGTCASGECCKTCTATHTKAPTATLSPIPTTILTPTPFQAGQTCNLVPGMEKACQGYALYTCTHYPERLTPPNNFWNFSQTCFNLCPGSTTDTCQDRKCCPENIGTYCATKLTESATTCNSFNCSGYNVYCWPSYADYKKELQNYTKTCVKNVTSCTSCIILHDTCGGDANACPSGEVSHIDNCNNVFCGEPCPGGGGGGGCTSSCACAANICFGGGTCSDGCGGTCQGIKSCTGTIQAKAVFVGANRTCPDLEASTQTINGTQITIGGTQKNQTEGTTLQWDSMSTTGNTLYTVVANNPSGYAKVQTCTKANAGAYNQVSTGTLTENGTLSFLVGYDTQAGWAQAIGGDVYAKTQLTSSVPATYYFSLAGAMGDAGIVSYGTSDGYDFSLSDLDKGETQVSLPPAWLVYNPNNPSLHLYEQFATQFNIPGDTSLLASSPLTVTKPACGTSPCVFYVSGDLETTPASPWTIGSTEQMVVFVSGNAHINSPITITPGGFFALIVNGNISVDSTVGGLAANTVPALEGIYVASQFETGTSETVGTERLNIKGSVIADTFALTRNIGISNNTLPAEQFTFNPQLLFTMPDIMKEIPYVWQEVAP